MIVEMSPEEVNRYYAAQSESNVRMKDFLQDMLAMRKPIEEIVEFAVGHGFDCGYAYKGFKI